MKIDKTLIEIKKLKRKIASLEAKAAKAAVRKQKSDRRKVIALAKKLGYKSADGLFSALFGAGAPVAGQSPAIVPAAKPRKRARVTDSDRRAIIADLKSGKWSAAKIAKKHGVSVPTVNNIKKAGGLTKSRKAVKKPAQKRRAPKAKKSAPVPGAEKVATESPLAEKIS
jgi:transposase-like protein